MNKTYDFFPAALLGDMLTARLISDNLQIKASLRQRFFVCLKGKTGKSRVTVIIMSLVRSLVPFGLFLCFSGFLTVKLDRKSFGLCKNNGIK